MRSTLLLSALGILIMSLGQDVWADYPATILADSPLAYYRFEEPEGSDEIADSSGNNYEGFEVLDVEFGREGICGSSAAEFLGSSSVVLDLTMNPDDPEGDGAGNGLDDFTIETWMYTTSESDQQVYVSQKDGAGLGRSDMLITATLELGSYIGGGTRNSGIQPELETWYHFVMAVDGSNDELYFYIDGEPSENNPLLPANGIESADGEWVIGSHKNQAAQFYEGLLDEIAFYDYRLDDPNGDDDTADSRVGAHYSACNAPPVLLGDYNLNDVLDEGDLDLQAEAIAGGENPKEYDLNDDNAVDYLDRLVWVDGLKNTWIGDANLDMEFNSSDMVQAFAGGKYEKDEKAGWGDGDWNGDTLFGSSDMVAAFVAGGYEQGPKPAVARAVPEPAGLFLLILGLLGAAAIVGRREAG